MRRVCLGIAVTIAGFAIFTSIGSAQDGPYKVLKAAKVGGDGGFDYVYADADGRRLYIPRTGNPARVTVYNLDTQESVGEIANTNARGAADSWVSRL
jgi:hypothetical protein